jgi:hypothetical protein
MKQVNIRKNAVKIRVVSSVGGGTAFDFEIGTLVQSPCRGCAMRSLLPECCQRCDLLARIQSTLAGGVSSGHSVSPVEAYSVAVNER